MPMSVFQQIIRSLFCVFLRIGGGSRSGSFPEPLSAAEEKECFARLQAGDRRAREELILHNLRLVAHVVKKYANAQNQDDLMSVGSIGLIKAIDSFDPKTVSALPPMPENACRMLSYHNGLFWSTR